MTMQRRLNNLYRTLHNEHGVGVLPKFVEFTNDPVLAFTLRIRDTYTIDNISIGLEEILVFRENYHVGGEDGTEQPEPTDRFGNTWAIIRERVAFLEVYLTEEFDGYRPLAPNLTFVEEYYVGAPDIMYGDEQHKETLVFYDKYLVGGEEGTDEEPPPLVLGLEYLIFEIEQSSATSDGYLEINVDPDSDVFVPLSGRNLRFKFQAEVFVTGDFRDFGQATVSVDYYYNDTNTTEITYLVTYVFPTRSGLYVDQNPHTGRWINLGEIVTEHFYFLPDGETVRFLVRLDCAEGATATFRNVKLYGVI